MKRRQFNILLWDMTANTIKNYDVLPYLRECIYKESEFHEYEDLKNFIDLSAKSRFWSRCEYEILVSDWPKQQKMIKIDGYQQIVNNLDLIAEILWKELNYETREIIEVEH